MHALRQDSHLEKTCEDRKVDDRFSCLSVVGGAESRYERQQRGYKRRTIAVADRRPGRLRLMP